MTDALDFDPFEGDFGVPGDRTLEDKMVCARKEHVCFHCCGPIAVGELHRSRRDIADGQLMAFRWCAACCNAMAAQMDADDDEDDDDASDYPYEERFRLHKTQKDQL